MKLRDRLSDLKGEKVKIGGAVGFFYCGEVFNGIDTLIDEIGDGEKIRIMKALEKAKCQYKSCDQLLDERISNVKNTIEFEKARIRYLEVLPETYSKASQNATYYLQTLNSEYWQDYFRRYTEFLNHWKSQWQDLWSKELRVQRNNAVQVLHRNEKILEGLESPETRKRWKDIARERYQKIAEELHGYTVFSETEIQEEYPSTSPWDFGTHIIVLKSAIVGKYWDESECKADVGFQSRVRLARRTDDGIMDNLPF